MGDGYKVEMTRIPNCQVDDSHGKAYADAKLVTYGGVWAYVCGDCFKKYGCSLGLGKGQVLVMKGGSDEKQSETHAREVGERG